MTQGAAEILKQARPELCLFYQGHPSPSLPDVYGAHRGD